MAEHHRDQSFLSVISVWHPLNCLSYLNYELIFVWFMSIKIRWIELLPNYIRPRPLLNSIGNIPWTKTPIDMTHGIVVDVSTRKISDLIRSAISQQLIYLEKRARAKRPLTCHKIQKKNVWIKSIKYSLKTIKVYSR